MAEWTIQGEAGKAVDDTARSLAALQAEGVQPDFRSLASDLLEWDIWLADPTDDTVLIPELGQQIRLLRDGAREFEGTVTGRRIRYDGRRARARMRVEGPWWWLTQTPLSSTVLDQTGEAAERSQFVFPTGSPRDHLIALAGRAINLGAPIQQGSIASVFPIPRLSLRDMPISEAISEVMRWVADGIVYFDYSVSGFPALSMQRRPAASTVTITPGGAVVPDIRIQPRLDLQLEEVEVISGERVTDQSRRVTRWASETAGAASSGLPKRQIATVSGPEIDTWLPQNFTDSVVVRSKSVTVQGVVREELFSEIDPGLRAAQAGAFLIGPTEQSTPAGTLFIRGPEPALVDRDGEPVPAGFDFYLVQGEARGWFARAGIEAMEARLTAVIWQMTTFDINDGTPDDPLWYASFGGRDFTVANGTNSEKYWWTTVSVPLTLVKTEWADPTTLIRPEDYAWVNPPAGLAANLLATQNWLPWEGSLTVQHEDEAAAGHPLGARLNVAGFRPETANMGGMVSGYRYSPATGRAVYRLGPPPRHAYRDLVNRFRASGADNIVFLTDVIDGDASENPDPDPDLQVPFVPDGGLTYDGDALTYSGNFITYTEN